MPIALPAVRDIVTHVNEGIARELPEASDAGNNPTYAVSGLPAGISFDDGTRELSGSTTEIGPHWIEYTATHSDSSQAVRRFTLAVLPQTQEWLGGQTPAPADFNNHINTPIRYNAGALGKVYKPAPLVLPDSARQSVYYVDDEGLIQDIGDGEAGQYLASGGPAAAPAWADFDASRSSEKLSWTTSRGGGLGARGFGVTSTVSHNLGRPPLVVCLGVEFFSAQWGYTSGDVILFPMGWYGESDWSYPRIEWATATQVRIRTPQWRSTIPATRKDNGQTFTLFPQSWLRAAVYVHG